MTPALAKEMLAAFKASKLSVAAFARQHGIPKNRVSYWQHRIVEIEGTRKKPSRAVNHSNFAAVKTVDASSRKVDVPQPLQTLEATLPSGSRIVIHGVWDISSMKNWLCAIEAKA